MKEDLELLIDLLQSQRELLSAYKDVLSECDDDELKEALEDNRKELVYTHKEIVSHVKSMALELAEEELPDEKSDDEEDSF